MKCENCGKNEANFFFHSNINGKVEERHLCAECAAKLGYTRRMAEQRRSMMSGFPESAFFGGLPGESGEPTGFFDGFPGAGSLWNRFFGSSLMGRMLDNPFDDFFSDMPALGAAPEVRQADDETEAETGEASPAAPQKQENRFDRRRKLNALRMEMKKAIRQEDFERAAQLRDEIHAMEAE